MVAAAPAAGCEAVGALAEPPQAAGRVDTAVALVRFAVLPNRRRLSVIPLIEVLFFVFWSFFVPFKNGFSSSLLVK